MIKQEPNQEIITKGPEDQNDSENDSKYNLFLNGVTFNGKDRIPIPDYLIEKWKKADGEGSNMLKEFIFNKIKEIELQED